MAITLKRLGQNIKILQMVVFTEQQDVKKEHNMLHGFSEYMLYAFIFIQGPKTKHLRHVTAPILQVHVS